MKTKINKTEFYKKIGLNSRQSYYNYVKRLPAFIDYAQVGYLILEKKDYKQTLERLDKQDLRDIRDIAINLLDKE